jgi:hypothetical protein
MVSSPQLSHNQICTLKALRGGQTLHRNDDGDIWVMPSNETVWDDGNETEQLIRDGLIRKFSGFSPCFIITHAGRAALLPTHDGGAT